MATARVEILTTFRVEKVGRTFYLLAGPLPVYHAIGPSTGDDERDASIIRDIEEGIRLNYERWQHVPPRQCGSIAYSLGVTAGIQAEASPI